MPSGRTDEALMELNELLGDVKSETAATVLVGSRIRLYETLEQQVELVGGETLARVLNADHAPDTAWRRLE